MKESVKFVINLLKTGKEPKDLRICMHEKNQQNTFDMKELESY